MSGVSYPEFDASADDPKALKQGLPEHKGAKDCIWAIVFIVHFVVILGLAAYGFRAMNNAVDEDMMPADPSNPFTAVDIPWELVGRVGFVVFVCALGGLFVGMLWLWLMRNYPKQLIIFTMVLQIIFWVASIAYMFYLQAWLGAIMGLVGCLFTCYMWWRWRHRIPFAAAVLHCVATVTRAYPGTILFTFLCMLVQTAWATLWGYTSSTSYFYVTSATLGYVLYVFFLLSLYWTQQVIRNTGHVTVCGTFATWYFMGGNNANIPSNPTLRSAKRALTTSFGSICFGSLIVALIQTVRAILRGIARKYGRGNTAAQIVFCLIQCILGCIESLIRYFNKYAYTQVAIYGKSFCVAARDTWKLAHSRGVDAMINDSFIGTTLKFGIMLGSGVCFLIGALAGKTITGVIVDEMTETDYTWILFGGLGAAIGGMMMSQAMSVVDSGVATIFICWAMDPEALKHNDADLAARMQETWNGKAARQQRSEYEHQQQNGGAQNGAFGKF